MSSSLITLAVDREHDLPMPPMAIGLLIFLFFCVVMTALLMFGKGRPHS
ncbi:MAG: hypothetical protein M3O94_04100 [Actinomycetota bacterium]|jgi:hypothetical protein|nr:hypothetical protein [Actinomycetota bacterium]